MTDTTKHTAGPWHVSPAIDSQVLDANGDFVARTDSNTDAPDIDAANAALIASAPDLLARVEALEAALRDAEAALSGVMTMHGDQMACQSYCEHEGTLRLIRAALSAGGGE